MTCDEQLELWINGQSVHNPTRDECCPDFSCCEPKLLWPLELRIKFRDEPENRMAMLGMALSGAAAAIGTQVHIAGEVTPNEPN